MPSTNPTKNPHALAARDENAPATLVQRRSFAGRHLAVIEAARLAGLVGAGIHRDVSRWDVDELARYAGDFVDGTRARLKETARAATATIDKAYWLFSRTARGVPPAVAVPDAYAARLSAAADLRVLRSAEREASR